MILNSNSKTLTENMSFYQSRELNNTSQQLRNIDRRWNTLEQVSQKQKNQQKHILENSINDLDSTVRDANEHVSNRMEHTKLQIIQLQTEIQQQNEHSNYFSNQDEARQQNIQHFLDHKKQEQLVNHKQQKQECCGIIEKKFKQVGQIIEERQAGLARQSQHRTEDIKRLVQQCKQELNQEQVQRKKNQQKLLEQIENEVDQFMMTVQLENRIRNETEHKIRSMVEHHSLSLKAKVDQEKEEREFSTANILEMLEKITAQVQAQL